MRIFVALLVLLLCLFLPIAGCISAQSSTGAGAEVSAEGRMKGSTGSSSTEKVRLFVAPTTITITDKATNTTTVITTGGGEAETGSASDQKTDLLSKIEANAQASADASSKSAVNLSYALIALGILLIFSVGSRTLWPVIKKFRGIP